MAEIKSFPNNQNIYVGAEWVMKWLHGRTSGVFGAENNLAVSTVPDSMSVEISDGVGWLANANGDGIVFWNDSEQSSGSKLMLTHDVADGAMDRIDRIVVTWETTNYVSLPTISVLKGVASSNPVPPALTNNNIQRQISLSRVNIPAGTVSMSPSMITDERLDPEICGIVTETIKIDTSTMQNQFESLLKAIQNELIELESGVGVELKKLQFNNISISVSEFVEDATYEDYPFLAAVALDGVIASMIPEVIFALPDAVSGNFAPVAACYNGGVYIYAAEKPTAAVTVPTILCWKGENGTALGTTNAGGEGLSVELLWKNGNPSSDFGAGDVEFDKTDCFLYAIIHTAVNSTRKQVTFISNNPSRLYCKGFPSGKEYHRTIGLIDSGFSFDACYNWTTSGNNGIQTDSALVPLEIYGFKGVSA